VLAGGTTLHELAQRGLLDDVDALIDLQHLGLDYVRADRRGLHIGAMTTFTRLAADPLLRDNSSLQGLTEALAEIRPVQVRNVGTVGGAVCSGLPFFDLPPMLLALDARVRITGPRGPREVALERFYVNYFTTRLRPDELVTEIWLPSLPPGSRTAFQKFAITGDDWALINCGVRVTLDRRQVCRDARIALGGGVTPTIRRAHRAEAFLRRKVLNAGLIAHAVRTVGKAVETVNDARASAGYRQTLIQVLTQRALERVLARGNQR
jgi:CO/xanthine dehydrogenase FAD-binding subunit